MTLDLEQGDSWEAPFIVGDWLVDPRANEIRRGAEAVKLEPKVMRVLCFLAARPSSVVSREELESQAWAGMVVTSDAVTNTIIKLRKAFADDSRHPRYIETISKSGYRLIAEVGRDEPAAAPPSSLPPRRLRLARVLLPLLVVLAPGRWLFSPDDDPKPPDNGADALHPGQKPGIAVLPFDNLDTDPGQDYFADGITEELITDLSKLSGLLVAARNSAFACKGSIEDAWGIARELGVDYLLKGSVRRAGGESGETFA